MAIRVSPTEANPTHDISLTDGSTTIGLHLCNGQGQRDRRAIRQASTPRTSLQIQQGNADYSSYQLPYTPVTQLDWSGGRAQLDFKRDSTRFYDSYRVNTIHGDIILGPAEQLTTGYNTTQDIGTTVNNQVQWLNTYFAVACPFTASSSVTIRSIALYMYNQTGSSSVQVALWSNGAGIPSAQLMESQALTVSGTDPTIYTFPLIYAVTSGTTYWLVVFNNTNDEGLRIESQTGVGSYIKIASDAPLTTWSAIYTPGELYAHFNTSGSGYARFFKYRNSEMACLIPDDGGAPSLYINGHHGMATSNSADKFKLNTTQSLSAAALTDGVVKIYAGPGVGDDPNFRYVETWTTTGTNDTITVTVPWGTTHTAATEWATLGEDNWTAVTGHGLSGPITDICVVDDIIYFAQGDGVVVRKGRWNSGSWSWDDEASTTKATFIKLIPTTNGTSKVWFAQSTTSNVYNADPVAWPNDLTWTQQNSSKPCGNPATKITNMIAYGDPRIPYIFKEDGFGSIASGVYAEVPNAELDAVSGEANGKAACVFGVYLFFSLLDGFERYYDQHLDDIGPNREEGLPTGRKGNIVCAIPYPGGILCAVDAGATGYSSIMFWNSSTNGWSELYRGPIGERIRHMDVQPIPGQDTPDRLWFCRGQNIYYIHVAINPHKQLNYRFTNTGYLITSWYKTTLGEIVKFWRDVQLFSENLSGLDYYVTFQYQTDGDGDSDNWHDFVSTFQTSPVQRELLTAAYTVFGKRIRFKITLTSDSATVTPRVLAFTINSVTRVPPSKTWALTFQADDMNIQDAEGDYETLDMQGLLAQLEAWADSEQQTPPLLMHSQVEQFDTKYVFIDAPNVQIREVTDDETRQVKAIGSLSLYEA